MCYMTMFHARSITISEKRHLRKAAEKSASSWRRPLGGVLLAASS